MADNPVKPIAPRPPAMPPKPRTPAPVAVVAPVAPAPVAPVAPVVDDGVDEIAELRAQLERAEARIKELEAVPAAPNPFLALPPPSAAAARESVPLVQLAPQQTAFVAARPGSISISPSGLVSIMPFDGAKKKRRAMIVVVTGILLVVGAVVAVMVFSRAMH
jgi:hypothetical protein